MNTHAITVLLVDDALVDLTVIRRLLETSSDIEVVGTARNGKQALDMVAKLNPQVVCTDYRMPVMDGLEFTKELMASSPRPILVVTSAASDPEAAFKLIGAGALDVFPKPPGDVDNRESYRLELARKIKTLSRVSVFTRHDRSRPERATERHDHPVQAGTGVVVGASTGGPAVLAELFAELPESFPLPILCVQHISDGFLQGFIDWLRSKTRLHLHIAVSGERPRPGVIHFPQEGRHLTVTSSGALHITDDAPFMGHRPSVTVTMQSAVRYYGGKAVGVLLTGMGSDGALGMRDLHNAGGATLAQDEESCAIYGMPREAAKLGAAQYVQPPAKIGQTLVKLVGHG